ncbi:MAG: 1,6-anhydro-N-acetylmuramyl-L-alanine amidase AmpD [Gammaproteobacteria bacterium]|nr:MAG: 1,6-anhydro-N-acetylmuramyl-L-alanine amidase AmpD [Gammaproteobacteria bacterium]
MIIRNGWLDESATVRHCRSPNYNQRPLGEAGRVSLLVIHHISLPPDQFGGEDIERFFCNELDSDKHPFYQQISDLKVSAHALIKRNGAVVQFVNFNDRAWHAGQSNYQGRPDCNDFSIGIELEGNGTTPYRYAQYQVLKQLTKALINAYPDIAGHITGHENIAPERKFDPGPTFDWERYLAFLSR